MNDFVLKGFCKCGIVTIYGETKDVFGKEIVHYDMQGNKHILEPVWFLSAKQMKIVKSKQLDYINKVGWKKAKEEGYYKPLEDFLESNPFLVAKILKEAGEKEGGNK